MFLFLPKTDKNDPFILTDNLFLFLLINLFKKLGEKKCKEKEYYT